MKRPPVARWTQSLAKAPALSVRQPYAWLILHGGKNIENRTRHTKHRGPLLIHAGLTALDFTDANCRRIEKRFRLKIPQELQFGGIVGVVDVVDCVDEHASKWYVSGRVAFVLKNPRLLPFRFCKGKLGLFHPQFED